MEPRIHGHRKSEQNWNASRLRAPARKQSLWADEDALRASEEAGNRLSELTAETVGVTRKALEEYEVTLFDVDA